MRHAMHSVRDTSKESFLRNRDTGVAMSATETILNFMRTRDSRGNRWCTRREIAEGTGLPTATVSGLVRPLLDNLIIEESEWKRECPVSNRRAYHLCLPRQGRLL